MPSGTKHLTAGCFLALSGLHLAWGAGSSFPFANRDELADAVVGTTTVPGTLPCVGVAAALVVAASVVEDKPSWPRRIRRPAIVAVAGLLGLRGALGLAGRTDLVSPGSVGRRFRQWDRRLYAPLCLALAAGALQSGRVKR